MTKKILVCGSLGFVMSNFIRYLLYHTKDFEIVSVDKVSNESDAKRRYINRMNKFYIGDITDKAFLDRVILCENPNIIINGTRADDPSVVLGAYNLSQFDIPTIQLIPCVWERDKSGWWNSAGMMINNSGGKVLELPNCFGRWQKPTSGAAKIMKKVLDGKEAEVSNRRAPWTFSEDICSLIWFVVEKTLEKQDLPSHLKCPVTGMMNDLQIAEVTKEVFGLDTKLSISNHNVDLCYGFDGSVVPGWRSEGIEVLDALKKTVGWYRKNQWALV